MKEFTALKFRTMTHGAHDADHREYLKSIMSSRAPVGSNGLYKLERGDAITKVTVAMSDFCKGYGFTIPFIIGGILFSFKKWRSIGAPSSKSRTRCIESVLFLVATRFG